MSGGLNKQFLSNPRLFMQRYVFNTEPDLSLRMVGPGVHTLNLDLRGTFGSLLVAHVTKLEPILKSKNSHAFRAYYLPWIDRGAPSVQLGTEASYFFTSAITGCRLIIDAGTQPLVRHVDGGRYNNAQMDGMCNVRSNGANFGAQRYWDNGEFYGTAVVGVRSVAGWSFYAQSFNYNSTAPLNVVQV